MTRVGISAVVVASLCGVAFPGPVSAHHSIQAQFDINKTLTISGTVARIEFINPHSYLTVNVKDADGKVTKWAFEMAALAQLRKAGLSRADRGGLKPGDELTVIALAARDGSNSGLAQEIKMADGRVFKLAGDAPGQ
jgi:DNA/RNA endonuclease YhcR with UshA esterase domain